MTASKSIATLYVCPDDIADSDCVEHAINSLAAEGHQVSEYQTWPRYFESPVHTFEKWADVVFDEQRFRIALPDDATLEDFDPSQYWYSRAVLVDTIARTESTRALR